MTFVAVKDAANKGKARTKVAAPASYTDQLRVGGPNEGEIALAQQEASGKNPYATSLRLGMQGERIAGDYVYNQALNQMREKEAAAAAAANKLAAETELTGELLKSDQYSAEGARRAGVSEDAISQAQQQERMAQMGEVLAKAGQGASGLSTAGVELTPELFGGVGLPPLATGVPPATQREQMGNVSAEGIATNRDATSIKVAEINAAAQRDAAALRAKGGGKKPATPYKTSRLLDSGNTVTADYETRESMRADMSKADLAQLDAEMAGYQPVQGSAAATTVGTYQPQLEAMAAKAGYTNVTGAVVEDRGGTKVITYSATDPVTGGEVRRVVPLAALGGQQ